MNAEHFDVLVVGAGLSGIGAGVHLQAKCPGKSYLILEGREEMGGTWDLFQYPGIRSDSDMHTLGFNFKPWNDAKAIADGTAILKYIHETAEEHSVNRHIRYRHLVKRAEWSTEDAAWTVTAQRSDTGETVQFMGNFLYMCAGYYSYREGYTPEFSGLENYGGQIVHPQKWPTDLDYRNKKVVIIGSGATAMTLFPAMAQDAEHLIMLQRSPTYVISLPAKDRFANLLRALLPDKWAYAITRWRNVLLQQRVYHRTRTEPEKVRDFLLDRVRRELGSDYDVEKHFTPSYMPWDQRLCLVPDSDLFEVIRDGKASVVTDTIDSFVENGIRTSCGEILEADIIITATGLNLVVQGEMDFSVDGNPVDFAETWSYKGLMNSDTPNLAAAFGYINASWTLRADLISEYVCRLINHMDATGTRQVTPRLREEDRNMPALPWIQDFSAGYMQRAMHLMPKQSDREPWINPQNYRRDRKMFRTGELEDGVLAFDNPAPAVIDEPTQQGALLRAAP